nr:hypothetical protein [Tanacetum cinerariifolium]
MDNKVVVVKSTSIIPSPFVAYHGWSFVVEWYTIMYEAYSLQNYVTLCMVHESSRLFIFLYLSRSMGDVDTCLHLSLLGLCSLLFTFLSQKMVTHTTDTVTSILTQRELNNFCNTYNIPTELWPKLPGRDDTIKDAPAGKIGIYTWFLKFTNFRIPLSRFLLCVLEYYQINFSQLSVLGAAKVSHFKIMCRVLNYQPSLGTFRASILKDPLPSDNRVNAELLGLLDHQRTIIRRYPETFLCLVGLSHSFDDVYDLHAKRIRPDAAVASETVRTTGGKSPTALRRLESQSGPQGVSNPAEPHDGVRDTAAASAGGTSKLLLLITSMFRIGVLLTVLGLITLLSAIIYWIISLLLATGLRFAINQLLVFWTVSILTLLSILRDAEIAALKTRLEKAEHEAADVFSLHDYVSKLEARMTIKSEEVNTLNKHNVELLSKVSALESERGELNKHVIKLGGDCERLQKKAVGDAKRDMDNDLYPHMFIIVLGKVISLAINKGIQEGLKARIKHGKYEQTLAQVEAYDPRVKDEFVSTVTDFENVSFALLDELELLKDSPLASIMSALVLKDAQGNVDSTLELQRFQPSLDQVIVPIYSESSSISGKIMMFEVVPTTRAATERRELCFPLLGGTSSSVPPHGSSSGIADYQVYLGFI